jgi:probable F420-dependent oxidoreductase
MSLKFGTSLSKFTDFGDDVDGLVNFVRKADELGYSSMRLIDHVVGIVQESSTLTYMPYTSKSFIHECFTLMGYLAAVTRDIRLMTAILVLPQRQATLVAKQAAEIDILSKGRLMLGVGVGYNKLEFEAMGMNFADRGKRLEEQVQVLRAFWTQDVVNFKGQYHSITQAGLAPLPRQRPIPIWFGLGTTVNPIPPDVVLDRIGRLADGWLPLFRPGPAALAAIAKVHAAARAAGRNPESILMQTTLWVEDKNRQQLLDEIKVMRDMGAVEINVRFAADSVSGHMEAIQRFREVIDAYGNG